MKKRFKSQAGAERRVRELEKQLADWRAIAEKFHAHAKQLATLAADGTTFDNPLIAYDAKKTRDEHLRRMNMGPDGKFLS